MSGPQCLSVLGPCETLCQRCIDSHNSYVERTRQKAVDDATRVLQSYGYTVIPPGAADQQDAAP